MAQPLTIARPYAKAIFELVRGDEQSQQQWETFMACAAELCSTVDVLQNLNHPGFFEELQSWIDSWLKENRKTGLTDQECNMLHLLGEHGRLPVFPQIFEEFVMLCSQSHNAVIVHVKSASKLNDADQKELQEAISKKLGKDIVLEVEEDKSLMAGVIIEYDGQVIDQSMKGRLTQFARKLDD